MNIKDLRQIATDNGYLIFENNEIILFVGDTDINHSDKIVLNKKDHSVVECNVTFSGCRDKNMFNAVREYVKSIESDEQDEKIEEKGEQLTYKELKEIAKKNGYELNLRDCHTNTILRRERRLSDNIITISEIEENRLWIEASSYVDDEDVDMMEAAIAYAKTPPDDRGEPTIYIVPLPDLTTTDGEQQYLTNKSGHWFACRRKQELRQTWKEEHLCYVPEQYRIYAVEVEK